MRAIAPLLWFGYQAAHRLARHEQLGVKVLLVRDGQVLLVRQTYRRGWYIPGGGVKRGEPYDEAVRREAREELGASLLDLEFIGEESRAGERIVLFASRSFTFAPVACWEIAEAGYFPIDRLPPDTGGRDRRRILANVMGRDPEGSGKQRSVD
jgi:ADP-ribose pyrophosphatase YjhB (NUDIX family)